MSDPLPIEIGTFQGTCLGPALANVVGNDLTCHIPSDIDGFRITCVRYADDIQLGITGQRVRVDEMKNSLEKVLKVMTTWFQQNGMKVNASKTELLLCGDSRQLKNMVQPIRVQFMDKEIGSKNLVKNLGVYMDSNLSWSHHVKCISDRCFGILVALYHVRHILPKEILPRIIDSLVFSHLRYCVQVYGGANSQSKDCIQKVLNFAARVISGRRKFDHISDVLRELEWLNAQQFIDYSDLCMLKRLLDMGQTSPLAANLQFNRDVVQRETRQSGCLAMMRPRTNHGRRNFIYRASLLYNNLVVPLGNCPEMSYGVFKKHVKRAVRGN